MRKKNLLRDIATMAAAIIGIPANKLTANYNPAEFPVVGESEVKCVHIPFGTTAAPEYYPEEVIKRVQSLADQDDRTVKEGISTVLEASIFCTRFLRSRERENDLTICVRGMANAAYLLGDNGFPAYGLLLHKVDDPTLGHGVFLYREDQNRKFGTIGANLYDINPPIYKSLAELVSSMKQRSGIEWDKFVVCDFSDYISQLREGRLTGAVLNYDNISLDAIFQGEK